MSNTNLFAISRAHPKKNEVSKAQLVIYDNMSVVETKTYEPEREENALRNKKEEEKIKLEED